MRGHSAAPKHHSVLAHWQASGHAGVRDALCAIYPSATGFRFDGDDSEARFECSIFSLAGLKR
jgi:hypothetical protein